MQEANNESTEVMTVAQLRGLVGDIKEEISRVEGLKRAAEFRARRYNEITSRVKFLRKKPEKVERDLRRLYRANMIVDRTIDALNRLNAQLDQYNQQLEAA